MNTIIQQPYKGRWEFSRNDVSIGVVNGDYVIGFTARDQLDHILGHYDTPEDALDAVLFAGDIGALEAALALNAGLSGFECSCNEWAEDTFEAGAETWPES